VRARRSLLGCEVGEHIACGGEPDGAADDGLVSDILEDHRLTDAVGADEDGGVAGLDEPVGEELVDSLAIDLLGSASSTPSVDAGASCWASRARDIADDREAASLSSPTLPHTGAVLATG
jgi:hypothetical protein